MIENYSHSDHSQSLEKWLSHYGISLPPVSLFSDIGYIVNKTAIGFLFNTNSKVGYIDHVVANPQASEMARDESLNDLFKHLIRVAEALGIKFLTVQSRIPALQERLKFLGFIPEKEYMLYYKILGGLSCHG